MCTPRPPQNKRNSSPPASAWLPQSREGYREGSGHLFLAHRHLLLPQKSAGLKECKLVGLCLHNHRPLGVHAITGVKNVYLLFFFIIVVDFGSGLCVISNDELLGSNISWTRISSWEKHIRTPVEQDRYPLVLPGPKAVCEAGLETGTQGAPWRRTGVGSLKSPVWGGRPLPPSATPENLRASRCPGQ